MAENFWFEHQLGDLLHFMPEGQKMTGLKSGIVSGQRWLDGQEYLFHAIWVPADYVVNVRKIAEKNGVVYHHHDTFADPPYIMKNDDPCYVYHEDIQHGVHIIYSESYGPWQLAINADGTISRPGDSLRKMCDKFGELTNRLLAKIQNV